MILAGDIVTLSDYEPLDQIPRQFPVFERVTSESVLRVAFLHFLLLAGFPRRTVSLASANTGEGP
jgi:hypothetical protein